ncbi:hypothetical protein [Magnetospirillum sp. UT-4]|uniref:hypothetical protein n=1 Tax=Magnetospirillum sp. UT-4 TaxID=2681467 RepID=UPI00137EDD39|nr:hypothetical protein [Magnetospirillum sp. UT-4]CAA7612731.1 exported hypothetical protein [Magnetospirillum sp. UT-4]
MSARGLAHLLFRRRRLMAAAMTLSLALGGAAALLLPERWRAEAVLLAEPGRAGAVAAALAARGPGPSLSVAVDEPAAVVRLALSAASPAAAEAALAALVAGLSDDRGGDTASRLETLRRQQHLAAEAAAAGREAAVLADTLQVLRARLAKTPPTIALASRVERPEAAGEAEKRLFELQAREAELLGNYREDSAFVRNVREERGRVEALIAGLAQPVAGSVTSGPNPVHQQLEGEVVRTETALARASARERDAKRLLAAAGPVLDPAALAADAERQSAPSAGAVAVLQPARAAAQPGLSQGAVMGWAAAAGTVLALAAAGLAQALSSRFATPAEVERRLGLVVLTSLPREG